MDIQRKSYPTDVTDEEWSFVASYLQLCREDSPQRSHRLREVFNALRWMMRAGAAWRYLPHDFPPWAAVYQQTQRWIKAGVFDAMTQDLRAILRMAAGRAGDPTAAIFDSRTLRSSVESGPRAGYDGAKKKRGSKIHLAVDTLGHLLAAHVSPADEQDRAHVGQLAEEVQAATGQNVQTAFVDQGYTGESAAEAPHRRVPGVATCLQSQLRIPTGIIRRGRRSTLTNSHQLPRRQSCPRHH